MAVRTLILLACLSVAGCESLPFEFRARAKEEPQVVKPVTESRYCYKTIGKVNCYAQPLDGKEANRLVGYDGPAPRSGAGTGPLSP